jgi:predicted flap endonuclease-1-like 5' DNA nuclease
LEGPVAVASVKRIFGTLLFIIAFLVTAAFVFLLFQRNENNPTFKELFDTIPDLAFVVGAIIGFVIVLLTLFLLIKGSAEKARRQAFQEEQDRLAAERDRLAAFEASLTEPEKIGWGPDIMVYNLPTVGTMYRGWEKFNRRSKSWTYYFPRSVESAVYTNNYIPIDNQGNMLKLRTLIAGPPGAQSKDLGMAHTKRPVTIDQKALDALGPKWKARYEEQVARLQEAEAERAATAGGVTAATLGIGTGPKKGKTPPGGPAAESAAVTETTTTTTVTTTSSGGHSSILHEMESRFTPPAEPARAYYDYDGDVADVEAVEGIGRIYGEKLRAAGVHTTARLCYEDTQSLADRVGVPVRTVEQWKAMAELIKISGVGPQYAEALARSGINGIAELKRRSPGAISEQVNSYLDSLHTSVVGTKITEARVKSWQKAAAKMKKVRMKAPEK